MLAFQSNYDWQLQFLPQVKAIVGPYLLVQAPFDIDTREATDLIILLARDMRIGCRIRRPEYVLKYPWDFTIRSVVESGGRTELQKITQGFGDWLFYAHSSQDQKSLVRWFLVDLAALRTNLSRKTICPVQMSNGDGTGFAAFDIRKFPPQPPILIASSHVYVRAQLELFGDVEPLRGT